MNWDDYRFFLTIAREPSIRAAAAKIGVSHSTVLRRLDNLEEQLGTRVFERNTVGFALTAAGEDVLKGAEEMEESVQAIDRSVTGRDSALEGVVKISMSDPITHPTLLPDFTAFKQRYPGIKPAVELSYTAANLRNREADIAVRFTDNPPDDLVGREIGTFGMAPYATQAYIDQHQPLSKSSTAQIIAYGSQETWKRPSSLEHLSAVGFYDDILLQVTLCCSGLGIGILPTSIADHEPNLVQLSPALELMPVWVLYHSDLRYTSRVRVVRDFLVEELSGKFTAK